MIINAGDTVVEPGIDKQLGRNPLVELESKGVLPFQLRTLISRISIKSGLPTDVVAELPI